MPATNQNPRGKWPAATLFLITILSVSAAAPAASWFDAHWQFRRPLEVNWDAEHAGGKELATAQFYTAGHTTDAADVRVTQEDGRILPSHVLGVGPGDQVRLVFALTPGQTRYYVYFGNPDAPAPPAGTEDVQYRCGLLLEMRHWTGPRTESASDVMTDWTRAGPSLGQAMIDRTFYGLDPFGPRSHFLAKLTGSIVVPVDADYFFAGSVEGRGVVCLDGSPVWFIPGTSKEALFHINLTLKRGRHDFTLYCGLTDQLNISLAWRRPDMPKLEVIPRTAFGILSHAQAGALEQHGNTLTADFDVKYLAEAFVADNYSHRYQLTAHPPLGAAPQALKYDWDFGDGTSGGGAEVSHVYVTAGLYPLRLTVRWGNRTDSQTTLLAVDRDWDNLDHPADEPPFLQARIIARYDVTKVTEPCLPWMALIEHDAALAAPQAAAVARLAELDHHQHPDLSLMVLRRLSHELDAAAQADQAVDLWDRVPAASDLQPAAAAAEASLLTWSLGNFQRALTVAQRVADSTDPLAQGVYAQELVLNGRAPEGEKILDDLQQRQEKAGAHLAAVSGAMARTVEFRIAQKDWENGENDCQAWEARCPAAFLEGYSVVLRTSLMELKNAPVAAAKVAEAFAAAVPSSPYAPQLLDRASRWLAKSDPVRSEQLRDRLRTRYPEDPLSQQQPD